MLLDEGNYLRNEVGRKPCSGRFPHRMRSSISGIARSEAALAELSRVGPRGLLLRFHRGHPLRDRTSRKPGVVQCSKAGKIHMIEQRSPEWHQHRLGRLTASRIGDVRAKTGPGAARKNCAADLVAARLNGAARDGFTNAAKQWGTDQEPAARALYECTQVVTVQEVGFIDHPSLRMP